MEIANKIPQGCHPPLYQSHCQLLSKVPQAKLVDTWMDVCKLAPSGVITTAFLGLCSFFPIGVVRGEDGPVIADWCAGMRTNLVMDKEGSEVWCSHYVLFSAAESYLNERNLRVGGGGGTAKKNETYLDKHNLRSKGGRVSMAITKTDEPMEESEPARDEEQPYIPPSSSSGSSSSVQINNFNAADPLEAPHPPLGSNTSSASASTASLPAPPGTTTDTLPFNEHLIFELSKQVVLGAQFDMVLQTVADYQTAENKMWAGRVWANLASVRPLTTRDIYSVPPVVGEGEGGGLLEGGLEHLLRIIFTKFAAKEFAEGVFLLRAEFGADWFSPILQHPYCILRHTKPPAPIEIPISTPLPVAPLSSTQAPNEDPVPQAPSSKRQKRGTAASVSSTAELESQLTRNSLAAVPVMTASVQPPFESFIMFYLGPNVKEFCSVFRSVALVPGVNSWCAVVGAPSVALAVGNGVQ
ncbi:hypothetical protein HDU98_009777 [Podochytrium sp. JEL0797]|nr:hypothetical protein HDU98_009777 [Podochytrium sp. JEL0797]